MGQVHFVVTYLEIEGLFHNLENSIMNNNSVVNGYDYLTNSFPKETPPLDKDRILGIAKSSGLENPDFTKIFIYIFPPKIGVFHYFFYVRWDRLSTFSTQVIYCTGKVWIF
jgi:hypothetical protein